MAIACSRVGDGLAATRYSARALLRRAGRDGYVLVRDATCRLFGYHGLMDEAGGSRSTICSGSELGALCNWGRGP